MSGNPKPLSPGAKQMLELNVEDAPTPQQAQMTDDRLSPHDSAETYSQIVGKHTKNVFPGLDAEKKGKTGTILLVMFVGLSVFGAWGIAYGVQYAITPHVQGTCAPPAVIQSGGCYNVETSTGANGNTITTLVPAGHLGP